MLLRKIIASAILAFSIIAVPIQSKGQDEVCGTVISPFGLKKMAAFKERVKQREKLTPRAQLAVAIPMKLHIVSLDNGSGNLNEGQIQKALDDLADKFSSFNVTFPLCGSINYINNSNWADFKQSDEAQLTTAHKEKDVLNVYIVRSIENSEGGFICGYAYYPWSNRDFLFLDKDCALNGTTFAHEVGHFLGLFHTHGNSNTVLTNELVDGSNCRIAGDFICDTPADPKLGSSNVNSSCEYTGDTTDANGDFFNPDPSNIMSYSPKVCRSTFSFEQSQEMLLIYDEYHKNLKCNIQQVSRCEEDSLQLVALFSATGGNSWNNSWNLNEPMDNWYGLSINENGCPIELDLSDNNLSGSIPNLQLPQLKKLFANNNALQGNIPDFSGLPSLEKISLSGNQLSGNIPDFSQLPELDFLVIESNNLSGSLPDFSNIPKLRDLGFGNNQLGGIIPDFSSIPELRVLSLWKNNFTGELPDFSNIPKLVELNIGSNNIEGSVPSFSNLTQLERLDLWVNNFSGDVPSFNLPNLVKLDLSNNQISGVPFFDGLSSLNELIVNNNLLSFEDLLPNSQLNLDKYNYGDQGIMGQNLNTSVNAGNNGVGN